MEEHDKTGERLAALETGIKTLNTAITRLEAKIEAWNSAFVPRTEINEALKNRDERLKALEQNQTWLWRAIIGAVIGGIISLALKGGL